MEFNATTVALPLKRVKDGSIVTANLALQFMILDAPTSSTLPMYISHLQRHKVKYLVRVCDKTYRTDVLEFAKIIHVAMPFDDGSKPPPGIIDQWLSLIDSEIAIADPAEGKVATIGVHCLAGLGRAPFLVALALIEYCEVPAADAVAFIRERRPGAINAVQLKYLMKYKPRWGDQGGCLAM